ncbi:MAG: hypothetical protein JWN48_1468 [Myxococcaceae bacterium]|nr:hypothetical protein [Myxococcaceae bacterium]
MILTTSYFFPISALGRLRRLLHSGEMRIPSQPVARADLVEFLQRGPSLMAAATDDRRVVELTRCAAAQLAPDGRLYVAIPLPEGKRALDNIKSTGVIALSAAQPEDYATVQFKGSDAQLVDWLEKDRATALHRQRFDAMMVKVGMPAGTADLLYSSETIAIAFTPSEMFDQTPGPLAGLSLPR